MYKLNVSSDCLPSQIEFSVTLPKELPDLWCMGKKGGPDLGVEYFQMRPEFQSSSISNKNLGKAA
jgi:hypothetical protein